MLLAQPFGGLWLLPPLHGGVRHGSGVAPFPPGHSRSGPTEPSAEHCAHGELFPTGMRGGTAGDRTQGRWRRPWRLRAGANRPILLIVLILIVPLMGIANPIDPPWSGGWYDNADADQLMSKTMSPEGMAGLAIVAFAYMRSRAVESARSASRRRLELCDRTGARGPPHVTNVLTGQTLVSHHAPRVRLPFLRFRPRPLSACSFAAPGYRQQHQP